MNCLFLLLFPSSFLIDFVNCLQDLGLRNFRSVWYWDISTKSRWFCYFYDYLMWFNIYNNYDCWPTLNMLLVNPSMRDCCIRLCVFVMKLPQLLLFALCCLFQPLPSMCSYFWEKNIYTYWSYYRTVWSYIASFQTACVLYVWVCIQSFHSLP